MDNCACNRYSWSSHNRKTLNGHIKKHPNRFRKLTPTKNPATKINRTNNRQFKLTTLTKKPLAKHRHANKNPKFVMGRINNKIR